MLNQYEDVLTVEDVCSILMVGRNRVYELLNNQELKGFRIGKRTWRIPKSSVNEFIESLGNTKKH